MTRQFLLFICVILNTGLSEPKIQPEIVNLGQNMMEQLANDTRENADLFYKNFSTYLNKLQEINDLIWSQNGEDVSKGMAIFDALEDAGGPPHVFHDLDYKLLAYKYNWREDDEIKQIQSIVNDTKVLWEAVKDRGNRLRIGTWGIDSKEEEEPAPGNHEDSDGELH